MFVYWGAKWCPPCNQVKATLFNRQDFIERSRSFVPVYVDGDSPGAQKIGQRFHVSGYPTMVLFNPQGKEVTRLPGEVDAVRYTEVLTLGMNAARPVSAVLADALAKPASLTANDWRLLAFYSWDTDHQQVLAKERLPQTLLALADACPADAADTAMRLRLKALAAADAKAPARVDAATRAIGARPAGRRAARARRDRHAHQLRGRDRARPERAEDRPIGRALLAAFDGALQRLEGDTSLSRADRMQALIAQVDLARIDDARRRWREAGRQERSARAAAGAAPRRRSRAGGARRPRDHRRLRAPGGDHRRRLPARARRPRRANRTRCSKSNLAKSHSPYYLMSELASNAKKRGDKAEALRWYREAFEKSEGPATRLQWGSSYISALVDLAPGDEAAIETTTSAALARGGQAARRVLRAQRPLAAEGRQQAAGLEQGRQARRGDGAPAQPARHAVRGAEPQRRRTRDLPAAARRAGQGERLSIALQLPLAPAARQPAAMTALLSVERLSVRFGAGAVVDDVSFAIAPARSSRWSANRARASRSPRCRCSAWSTARRRAARIRFEGSDLLQRGASGRCAPCAAARSR